MTGHNCPRCHRPMNMGNSPNSAECTETDDDEGVCAAYAKLAEANARADGHWRTLQTNKCVTCDSLRERAKKAEAGLVYEDGFSSPDGTPAFQQGGPDHEMLELVTAERCAGMVQKIVELAARAEKAEAAKLGLCGMSTEETWLAVQERNALREHMDTVVSERNIARHSADVYERRLIAANAAMKTVMTVYDADNTPLKEGIESLGRALAGAYQQIRDQSASILEHMGTEAKLQERALAAEAQLTKMTATAQALVDGSAVIMQRADDAAAENVKLRGRLAARDIPVYDHPGTILPETAPSVPDFPAACRLVENTARSLGKDCQIIFTDTGVSLAPLSWSGDSTGKDLHEAFTDARKLDQA